LVYQDPSVSQLQPIYARHEQFASYQGPIGYNWFHDPYSRGTYSCLAAGQEEIFTETIDYHGEKVKKLFAPIDDRLFFSGEHTSILTDGMGTMEAAVEAGERTARMCLR
jgi:monoamine oxidase